MKKDLDETIIITRVDNTGIQIKEEPQDHKSEDKEACFTGNRILEMAISQGLIRKSILRNPRYLLVLRRLRLLAHHKADSDTHAGNIRNIEYLDPKKIFSN